MKNTPIMYDKNDFTYPELPIREILVCRGKKKHIRLAFTYPALRVVLIRESSWKKLIDSNKNGPTPSPDLVEQIAICIDYKTYKRMAILTQKQYPIWRRWASRIILSEGIK